ncbi:MAG: flagellar P-ring protein precursor FlgI [Planctomycetota bacterium]|jgi:flagellar P-ring protein precursor FlgI
MYATLLFSLAPFMTPVLAQDVVDNSDDVSAEQPRESQVTGIPFWGGVEAPSQPSLRSITRVRRTARRTQPVRSASSAMATRAPVSSLVSIRGMEDNHVFGVGLVTGLAGTGDSGDGAKLLLQNLLMTLNTPLPLQALSSKNIAVVRVEATIPAGIRVGQRINVRASTLGDCNSLQGGTLAMTELTDITGRFVYATASGPITVAGFSAGGESATVTRNHVTVGTMPGGGKIEREVETSLISEHGYLYLDIKSAHDTLGNVVNIVEAVNDIYPGVAVPSSDGKSVHVKMPGDLATRDHVAFADSIMQREVLSVNVARVIINERSGTIVMGGDVRLHPGVITHGNLTVSISETTETSQPGPLSNGTTEQQISTDLDVEEVDSALTLIPGANTLQEVVDVLNVLGTTPRDMITILQAMSMSGTLLADIRRM